MGEVFIPQVGKMYYEGNINLLQKKIVCIIGTRTPSDKALSRAYTLSTVAVSKGYATLSGLAKGIDTKVHEASMNSTIAVIPTALDMPTYPKENAVLKNKIIKEGGLVISPFPSGATLNKSSFVIRDKFQAFLSLFIVVVESNIDGGSMHALKWGASHNRMTYVFNDEKRLSMLKGVKNVSFIDDEDINFLFD